MFHGPVRVPEEAALGQAKATYSFDDWLDGRVAPSTIELPVAESIGNAPARDAK